MQARLREADEVVHRSTSIQVQLETLTEQHEEDQQLLQDALRDLDDARRQMAVSLARGLERLGI